MSVTYKKVTTKGHHNPRIFTSTKQPNNTPLKKKNPSFYNNISKNTAQLFLLDSMAPG